MIKLLTFKNMSNKYFFEYNEISKLRIKKIIEKLLKTDGIKICELKISDLIFFNGKPIDTGCGVYIFKNDKNIFYIGKNSARCFAERIPAHFDLRKVGWFNSLLKLIAKVEFNVNDYSDIVLQKAARRAIKNFSLILINFKWEEYGGTNSIETLEDLLRCSTQAANSYKKKRFDNLEMIVKDFVNQNKKSKD